MYQAEPKSPDDYFEIFKKNTKRIRESLSFNLAILSEHLITITMCEKNEEFYTMTLPIFLYPATSQLLAKQSAKKSTKKFQDPKFANELFQVFMFEFSVYYTLSFQLCSINGFDEDLYQKAWELIATKHGEFYGEGEIQPKELAFYLMAVLSFPKDFALEIMDDDLAQDVSDILIEASSHSTFMDAQKNYLFFAEPVNYDAT